MPHVPLLQRKNVGEISLITSDKLYRDKHLRENLSIILRKIQQRLSDFKLCIPDLFDLTHTCIVKFPFGTKYPHWGVLL